MTSATSRRRGDADPAAAPGTLKAMKAQAERQIVVAALETHGWHVTKTAEALGLADHSSLLEDHAAPRPQESSVSSGSSVAR